MVSNGVRGKVWLVARWRKRGDWPGLSNDRRAGGKYGLASTRHPATQLALHRWRLALTPRPRPRQAARCQGQRLRLHRIGRRLSHYAPRLDCVGNDGLPAAVIDMHMTDRLVASLRPHGDHCELVLTGLSTTRELTSTPDNCTPTVTGDQCNILVSASDAEGPTTQSGHSAPRHSVIS